MGLSVEARQERQHIAHHCTDNPVQLVFQFAKPAEITDFLCEWPVAADHIIAKEENFEPMRRHVKESHQSVRFSPVHISSAQSNVMSANHAHHAGLVHVMEVTTPIGFPGLEVVITALRDMFLNSSERVTNKFQKHKIRTYSEVPLVCADWFGQQSP